jgi:hypothetical protein
VCAQDAQFVRENDKLPAARRIRLVGGEQITIRPLQTKEFAVLSIDSVNERNDADHVSAGRAADAEFSEIEHLDAPWSGLFTTSHPCSSTGLRPRCEEKECERPWGIAVAGIARSD